MYRPGLDTWLWAYRARQWDERSSSLRIAQMSRFLALEYTSFGGVPYSHNISFEAALSFADSNSH